MENPPLNKNEADLENHALNTEEIQPAFYATDFLDGEDAEDDGKFVF